MLVSHLKSEAHADIQESELILCHCDGFIHEIEVDAQGGVVAGNMKIRNTELNGELHVLESDKLIISFMSLEMLICNCRYS